MTTAFSFTSDRPITAQPNAGGEKVIFRSDNAADTGNYTHTGKVSGTSTAETNALTGKREVQSTNTFTDFTSGALSAAQTGNVRVYGQGTAGTAFLRAETNPADGTTVTFGLTGFTQAYRFKNTTASAFDVKIGADATATMLNLKKAINADGAGDGTDYHTGTTANPYVTGSASGTIITLTDRLAVSRQLAWSFAQSSTHLSLPSTLSGGVTGTLLATLAAGDTHVYDDFSLSSEGLATDTLPALFTGTSNWVRVSGKLCALRFKCANVGSAIALNYQTSTDGSNAATGATSITSLDDNAVATPQRVIPGEQNVEYIRLNITANANTTDSAVDARVIYG